MESKRILQEKGEQKLLHEETIDKKDLEIARLKARLLTMTSPNTPPSLPSSTCTPEESRNSLLFHQHYKATLVNSFSAKSPNEQWDNWLSTFERAAEWNNWTDSECLLQLAGHLRGKAQQEFSLPSSNEKATFSSAIGSCNKEQAK